MFEQISFLAYFAKQIAGLPEGAEVRIVNVPVGEI
jgi:hypothetical protein